MMRVHSLNTLPEATHGILRTAMLILTVCDDEIFAHGEQVACEMLALAPKGDEEEWYWAGLLHDLGKLVVGYELCRKRRVLTIGERQIVQGHTLRGADLLNDIGAPRIVVEGAKLHHERWNGTGYPFGLSGHLIPEIARALAVADTYSALTCDRPYRRARTHDEARREIEKNAGIQFAPDMVTQFFDGREHAVPASVPSLISRRNRT